MSYRLAKSLDGLRAQVNARAPKRSKVSDGTIGDTAHASRTSDHNPWVKDGATGVVTALDITHDPAGGCDSYALAQSLIDSRDPRIKYVISNGQIASKAQAWTWRKYTGTNPHTRHVHVSVEPQKALFDNTSAWHFELGETDATVPSPAETMLRKGARGEAVQRLQRALNAKGAGPALAVDGDFGARTDASLRAYQRFAGLVADGVAGIYTWEKLEK